MNTKTIDTLKEEYKYKEARDLLSQIEIKDAQNLRDLAECYYKDLELSRDFSYKESLEILDKIKDDDDEPHKTLQITGAIYKRKGEYEKNLDDLYISIKEYEESYTKYKKDDKGYGGINASYLYDVLAQEMHS